MGPWPSRDMGNEPWDLKDMRRVAVTKRSNCLGILTTEALLPSYPVPTQWLAASFGHILAIFALIRLFIYMSLINPRVRYHIRRWKVRDCDILAYVCEMAKVKCR